MAVRFKLDQQADALYVWLSSEPYAFGEDIDKERRIDYDANRRPRGVELLNVSGGVELDGLPNRDEIGRLLGKLKIRVFA